MSSLRICPRTL